MPALFIKNVNILNPFSDEILDERTVFIKGNKIEAIGVNETNPVGNYKVIDGQDSFLLPGFIDSHAHIMANGFHKVETMKNPLALHFYRALTNMKATLNAGVTSVRDCGLADIGVKMAQEDGMFESPRLNISVKPLTISGGHFDFFLNSGFDMEIKYPGYPSGVCDGVEEVLKKTRQVIRAQPDFIKIMASGGVLSAYNTPDSPQFNSKELATIVNEARVNKLNVAAHCHSLAGMNNCIKAGVKSIEHGTFIDRKTAQAIAKKRMYLTPTLVVHHTLMEEGFPPWDSFAKERLEKLKEVVKIQKENISVAYEEGVRLLMGSDCGVIDHGRNLGELKYLVDIGMEPIEAIEAGTIRGAKFFNQDDKLGSIEPGKLADMILVKGNPVDDISILADNDNIKKVILDGKLVKDNLI